MTATNIEWAEAVWNPVVGCTPVSPGCLNCYAAGEARRWGSLVTKGPRTGQPVHADYAPVDGVRIAEVKQGPGGAGRPVFTGKVRTLEHRLDVPLKRRTPTRWFVNSMSDLFHEAVPFEFVDRVFAVMALCPQHTFLVLTKRPERMAEYFSRSGVSTKALSEMLRHARPGMTMSQTALNIVDGQWRMPHVWLGTSVEDQARADERITHLLRCPAAVRFLSCEPLLGAVTLRCPNSKATDGSWADLAPGEIGFFPPLKGYKCRKDCPACGGAGFPKGINWIIGGGESGTHARPSRIGWYRGLRDQCRAAGVPYFQKQLGGNLEIPNDSFDEWPRDGDGLGYDLEGPGWSHQGDHVRVRLEDRKGGDPAEWPEDLRVREMPAEATKRRSDGATKGEES